MITYVTDDILVARRAMIGVRVEADDRVIGILQGVPDRDTVIIQDPATWKSIVIKNVERLEVRQFRCSCGARVNKLHDDLCANCYRTQAERKRAEGHQPTPCDFCGRPGAFRNPKGIDNRDILCARCHADRGDLPKDFNIIVHSTAFAKCVSADINSPLHKWKQLKATRWRCEGYGCNADRYTPPTR